MSAIGQADLPGKGPGAGSTEYDPGAYELLKTIDDPAALRALDRRGLRRLADELRTFILESVSQTGGHLSSNLGTVELTIALHHVFNTPHDRIVWDVGHQTYPHKILTGRREAMSRIRMSGGISGFPRRGESEYDTFGTAHSSTSVSEWAVPKVSYSLSPRRGKPEIPPLMRMRLIASRRPVRIL